MTESQGQEPEQGQQQQPVECGACSQKSNELNALADLVVKLNNLEGAIGKKIDRSRVDPKPVSLQMEMVEGQRLQLRALALIINELFPLRGEPRFIRFRPPGKDEEKGNGKAHSLHGV